MRMDAIDYFSLRDSIAGDLRRGLVEQTAAAIAQSVETGAYVDKLTAAEFTERFFNDLRRLVGR